MTQLLTEHLANEALWAPNVMDHSDVAPVGRNCETLASRTPFLVSLNTKRRFVLGGHKRTYKKDKAKP